MSRPQATRLAAMVAVPLLTAASILPGAFDEAIPAALAGGLPLAWATLAAIVVGRANLLGLALAVALPFSAYALAAFSAEPSLIWLVALAAVASCAASLGALALRARSPAKERDRVAVAVRALLGLGPGLAAAGFGSPLASLGISALIASLALLASARRPP